MVQECDQLFSLKVGKVFFVGDSIEKFEFKNIVFKRYSGTSLNRQQHSHRIKRIFFRCRTPKAKQNSRTQELREEKKKLI